jgi:hypothetical protein
MFCCNRYARTSWTSWNKAVKHHNIGPAAVIRKQNRTLEENGCAPYHCAVVRNAAKGQRQIGWSALYLLTFRGRCRAASVGANLDAPCSLAAGASRRTSPTAAPAVAPGSGSSSSVIGSARPAKSPAAASFALDGDLTSAGRKGPHYPRPRRAWRPTWRAWLVSRTVR